jgi:predicted DsbA family dithiol-disulfide isomerase
MSDLPAGNHVRSSTPLILGQTAAQDATVLHWYDLTCPFCYLGQARTSFLEDHGLTVVELAFQAHPDLPKEGVHIGERVGAMYQQIESEAVALHLPLHWPPRLPNSRLALSAAEWVRRNEIQSFAHVQKRLFQAHFADGLDIGDLEIVLQCIGKSIHEPARLRESLDNGEAFTLLGENESFAHKVGVSATPSWLLHGKMIRGFVPEAAFEPFIPIDQKTEGGGHHSHGERR